MSGGSKDPTQAIMAAAQNIAPVTPPWLQKAQQYQIPEAMPGQLQGLATDLASGGFGAYAPNLAHLQGIYSPATAMRFGQPAPTTKPKVATTPKKPVVADPTRTPAKAPAAPKTSPYTLGTSRR